MNLLVQHRILEVSSEQWQAILEAAQKQSGGYLEDGESLIESIVDQIPARIPLLYLQDTSNQPTRLLKIKRLNPTDYSFKQAPFLFRHPYALYSPFLLAAGLLCYIFLPRKSFSKDTLSYGAGFQAVVGPDLVGLMIATGFFTLGLLVGMSAAPAGILSIFSSGLILISCVLWLFALFGIYMLTIAARYAGSGLQCVNGQLVRYLPSGTQRISMREIVSVQLGQWKASKWVTRVGFLVSLFNWRALGPTLLNASRTDPQIEVHLKGGKTWKFTLTGAQNVEPFLKSLQKHDVKMDSSLGKKAAS